MKKEHKLEITLCGRVAASFRDEKDLMETAAARITEWDAEARQHANRAVELALAIGATLLAVKEKLPHGTFLLWVSQNCGGLSERTAQKYMKAAAQAARCHELAESAGAAPTDEEREALAAEATDTERHYERSLSQIYRDWGIVKCRKDWGGPRAGAGRKAAAEPTVEEELDEIANAEGLLWAQARDAIGTLSRLDGEKDVFRRLDGEHLAVAAGSLADLSRKAGEALKSRLAEMEVAK